MAICKTCGNRYSKWTAPVSAKGVCADCFGPEPGNEPEAGTTGLASSLEAGTTELAPSPEDVPAPRRKERIRWRSFLPRSRSKVVFVLVMACYSITLGRVVSELRWVTHVQSPPKEFYLDSRDPVGNAISLLLLAPVLESLLLVGVFELVRRARAPEVGSSPGRGLIH
jgi:hypothetical protein